MEKIVYDTLSFPAALFGSGVCREVRLIVSPETTGSERLSIVYTSVPAGAVSEGHVHADFDEYIHFDIAGRVIVDGEAYDVPARGVVHARAGCRHECVNTSPSETLSLFCVFVPPLRPYGKYPELIEQTRAYLAK